MAYQVNGTTIINDSGQIDYSVLTGKPPHFRTAETFVTATDTGSTTAYRYWRIEHGSVATAVRLARVDVNCNCPNCVVNCDCACSDSGGGQ